MSAEVWDNRTQELIEALELAEDLKAVLRRLEQTIRIHRDHKQVHRLEALEQQMTATPPSSPDTAPTAAAKSGQSTSSETYFLAREDPTGGLLITATVTFPEVSSTQVRGNVRNNLRAAGWMLLHPETSASPSQSGPTPSTQDQEQVGPTAGGTDESRDHSENAGVPEREMHQIVREGVGFNENPAIPGRDYDLPVKSPEGAGSEGYKEVRPTPAPEALAALNAEIESLAVQSQGAGESNV